MSENFMRCRVGVTLALLALPASARAQTATRAAPAPAPARAVATAALRAGAVQIDGRLDEPAWQHAIPITGFRQYMPDEGKPASLPTQVWVLYDEQAIYIGARMSEPGGVVAPLARRDQLLDGNGNNGAFNSLTTDKLVVELDPYHNHLDDILFEVNPAGVKGDQSNYDPSWDPIWDAAAHVDSAGWTAEMRIPFSQLRFSRDSLQTWGLQVWRYLDRRNERDMWVFWARNAPGGPAFFGQLDGMRITSRPRQLELLPYTVTGTTFKDVPAGDPYHSGHDSRVSAGGDLKYLLTSNLTLDATLNPDFGQVEVDPAVLNLSAFETYYQEKRPFFIAGSSAFDFGGMNCMFCSNSSSLDAFYSRRIGRPPQLNGFVSDEAAFADTPDNTAILGAAKITGRTQKGYTIGILDAVTNRETAHYRTAVGAPEASQVVEPLANYFVGRVKKEFRNGATTFGGIFTSTARQTADSVVSDRLHSHAEAAGVDWYHTWDNRNYSWMGSFLGSSVAGSPAAIAETQRSSAHYYQRPDRRTDGGLFNARFDGAATALRGYGLYTRVAKTSGSFLWEAMTNVRSPGFEVNDLAFLDRSDYVWLNGNLGWAWNKPTHWYRDMAAIAGATTQYDGDFDRTDLGYQAFWQISFLNYWRIRAMWIGDMPSYDDRLTRGGPVVRRSGYHVEQVEISTDARKPVVFDFSVQPQQRIQGSGQGLTLGPGIAFKPAANIFVQLSPRYSTEADDAQYVTSVSDPTATAFYGNRYVFAYVHTKYASLDTRVNWTFTPNLTLQLYAQPFVASGAYSSFREFRAPRTIDKLVYGRDVGTIQPTTGGYRIDPDGAGPAQPFNLDNPDFTDTSLRGTAVLRWEYRRGSTLYFVWTQQRFGEEPVGSFDFYSARNGIFRDRPTNVFQIKATYWLGR